MDGQSRAALLFSLTDNHESTHLFFGKMTRAGAGRAMGHSGIKENIGSFNGPSAGAAKYDVITALLVMASQGEAEEARLALRLSLLITARFNWRKGVFAVGQKELARMWGVTERTVKREMAELRARGWIEVAVPAARGRVAEYRILFEHVLGETMPFWPAVGPDFAARLIGAPATEEPSNVVPLRSAAMPAPQDGLWGAVATRLKKQDPAIYEAWFAQLVFVDTVNGVLTLLAPTKFLADYVGTHFHGRVLAATLAEDRSIRDVKVIAPGP